MTPNPARPVTPAPVEHEDLNDLAVMAAPGGYAARHRRPESLLRPALPPTPLDAAELDLADTIRQVAHTLIPFADFLKGAPDLFPIRRAVQRSLRERLLALVGLARGPEVVTVYPVVQASCWRAEWDGVGAHVIGIDPHGELWSVIVAPPDGAHTEIDEDIARFDPATFHLSYGQGAMTREEKLRFVLEDMLAVRAATIAGLVPAHADYLEHVEDAAPRAPDVSPVDQVLPASVLEELPQPAPRERPPLRRPSAS